MVPGRRRLPVMRLSLWLAAFAGCMERLPPPPVLQTVSPKAGPNDVATPLALGGEGFLPRVSTDFAHRPASKVDDVFVVRLGETALTDVVHLDDQRLEAVVPPGLEPGIYDVSVFDPYQRQTTLLSGYRVVAAGTATALAFAPPEQTVLVGQCSDVVSLEARDGLGRPALLDAPSTLTLTASLPGVTFHTNATCTQPVTTLTFAAGALGTSFRFRSSTAGALTLTALSPELGPATQNHLVLAVDGGTGVDAGTGVDGGSGVDAGTGLDAGSGLDGGGGTDGGADAGLDAGVATPDGGHVVISEFSASGGKTGATFDRDYVVLKNTSGATVNLSGWSLQHYKTGKGWVVLGLPSTALAPGQAYVIEAYNDGTGGMGLPGANLSAPANSDWNLSTSNGEALALRRSSTALTGCAAADVVDLVGYNTGPPCTEGGTGAPTSTPTLAARRKNAGTRDTDDNAGDFELAASSL